MVTPYDFLFEPAYCWCQKFVRSSLACWFRRRSSRWEKTCDGCLLAASTLNRMDEMEFLDKSGPWFNVCWDKGTLQLGLHKYQASNNCLAVWVIDNLTAIPRGSPYLTDVSAIDRLPCTRISQHFTWKHVLPCYVPHPHDTDASVNTQHMHLSEGLWGVEKRYPIPLNQELLHQAKSTQDDLGWCLAVQGGWSALATLHVWLRRPIRDYSRSLWV